MDKINIEKDKILDIFNESGKESVIYKYENNNTLLKIFRDEEYEKNIYEFYMKTHDYDTYIMRKGHVIDKESLNNKIKKLELINNINCLENEIKILNLAFENDSFKGYTMTREYLKPINIYSKKKIKILWLKNIKEKIIELNKNNIYIGDYNENNFLTDDNHNIKLCDLDNLRINDLDFDTKHIFINKFERNCNKKEYIDSYCFNLFTIAFLQKICNDPIFILNSKLPRDLKTKENDEIFESMKHLDNTYQYKFLIDNIK